MEGQKFVSLFSLYVDIFTGRPKISILTTISGEEGNFFATPYNFFSLFQFFEKYSPKEIEDIYGQYLSHATLFCIVTVVGPNL